MQHDAEKLYEDILRAIEEINHFCRGKDFQFFKSDRGLQLIVEREFEIIGEAMSRFRRDCPDEAEGVVDTEKIVGLRNVLAHGYDVVDYEILWDIVENKLPDLEDQIKGKI